MIFVIGDNQRGSSYSVAEVRQSFDMCSDHRQLAATYRVSPRLIRKILSLAGVDYLKELHKRYQRNTKISDIATAIRMNPRHLAQQLKASGYAVRPGRRRPPMTQKQISEAVLKRQTIHSVAQNLLIHWETAKKVLVERRFLGAADAKRGAPYSIAVKPIDTS